MLYLANLKLSFFYLKSNVSPPGGHAWIVINIQGNRYAASLFVSVWFEHCHLCKDGEMERWMKMLSSFDHSILKEEHLIGQCLYLYLNDHPIFITNIDITTNFWREKLVVPHNQPTSWPHTNIYWIAHKSTLVDY